MRARIDIGFMKTDEREEPELKRYEGRVFHNGVVEANMWTGSRMTTMPAQPIA